jgi:hypothetical protein
MCPVQNAMEEQVTAAITLPFIQVRTNVVLWHDLQFRSQQWLTMLISAALFPPKDYDVLSSRYISDEQLSQLIIPCHLNQLLPKENIRNVR